MTIEELGQLVARLEQCVEDMLDHLGARIEDGTPGWVVGVT